VRRKARAELPFIGRAQREPDPLPDLTTELALVVALIHAMQDRIDGKAFHQDCLFGALAIRLPWGTDAALPYRQAQKLLSDALMKRAVARGELRAD
jgi:hypothetical protein